MKLNMGDRLFTKVFYTSPCPRIFTIVHDLLHGQIWKTSRYLWLSGLDAGPDIRLSLELCRWADR